MTLEDILVVAPFNLQVRCLPGSGWSARIRIGSVDKFQGQEAPVVIVSLCSSTLGRVAPRRGVPAEPQPAQRRDITGAGAGDRGGVSGADGCAVPVAGGDAAGEPALSPGAVYGRAVVAASSSPRAPLPPLVADTKLFVCRRDSSCRVDSSKEAPMPDDLDPGPTPLPDVRWNIGRLGRTWSGDEARDRWELTPEKFEMDRGKLFWDETQRLTLLALLLENVGVDQAVRLGDPEVWRAAIRGLEYARPSQEGRASGRGAGSPTKNPRALRSSSIPGHRMPSPPPTSSQCSRLPAPPARAATTRPAAR